MAKGNRLSGGAFTADGIRKRGISLNTQLQFITLLFVAQAFPVLVFFFRGEFIDALASEVSVVKMREATPGTDLPVTDATLAIVSIACRGIASVFDHAFHTQLYGCLLCDIFLEAIDVVHIFMSWSLEGKFMILGQDPCFVEPYLFFKASVDGCLTQR